MRSRAFACWRNRLPLPDPPEGAVGRAPHILAVLVPPGLEELALFEGNDGDPGLDGGDELVSVPKQSRPRDVAVGVVAERIGGGNVQIRVHRSRKQDAP